MLLTMEADLAGRHGGLFVEIAPWCVDDCDVIFLVAWLVSRKVGGGRGTFNGIGFSELSTVDEEFLGNRFPRHSFRETKINVCGRQIVHMELALF